MIVIDSPALTETQAQTLSVISVVVTWENMKAQFHTGVEELISGITAQGIQIVGPLLAYHHRRPTETLEFDIAFPTETPVKPQGWMKPSLLKARTVAKSIYWGDYSGLSVAWPQLCQWVADQGYTAATDLWECYVVGPNASADPAAWVTELNLPLVVV